MKNIFLARFTEAIEPISHERAAVAGTKTITEIRREGADADVQCARAVPTALPFEFAEPSPASTPFILRFQEQCIDEESSAIRFATQTHTKVANEAPDCDRASDDCSALGTSTGTRIRSEGADVDSPLLAGTKTLTAVKAETLDADRAAHASFDSIPMRSDHRTREPAVEVSHRSGAAFAAGTKTTTMVRAEMADVDHRSYGILNAPRPDQ